MSRIERLEKEQFELKLKLYTLLEEIKQGKMKVKINE